MSEVIRRALAVCDFVLTQQEKGATVLLRSSDGTDTRLPLF
jgi:hypothetical protein